MTYGIATKRKPRLGDSIILKGNLHTTEVMLRGSVDDVIAASKQTIDDAGQEAGLFCLPALNVVTTRRMRIFVR